MRDGRRTRGFTLLEIVVVVALLALLMSLALPTYLDRLVREQVVEALPLADLLKPPVEAAWRAHLPLPVDNAAAGLPLPEKIVNQRVRSVTLDRGAIHITFGNSAHKLLQGRILTLRPAGVPDTRVVPMVWLCAFAPVPAQMTPQGEDHTTVPKNLLPLRCRI